MSDPYGAIARIATSPEMRARVAACAAQEGEQSPENWSATYAWLWAASPGWGTAWAYAAATGIANPALDEAVITDGMILAAVAKIRADQTSEA